MRGLVVFETFLRPMRWSDWPPRGAERFRAYRTAGVGEAIVLERERVPREWREAGLSDADRAVYSAPYPDQTSRRPLLAWPREIPIDGEPADVAAIVTRYGEWASSSPSIPKLILSIEGNGLSAPRSSNGRRKGRVARADVVHHVSRTVP